MEPTSGIFQYYPRQTERTYQFLSDKDTNFELNDLYTNEYKLIKPLPIKLSYEEGSFVFTQEELNLWGEGPTLKYAEKELAGAVIKLYKKLSSLDRNKIGPYPLELFNFLKEFIS